MILTTKELAILQDLFRVQAAESAMDAPEGDDAHYQVLYERGLIEAKPLAGYPYNMVPSALARSFYELSYPTLDREPRYAFEATLVRI